MADTTLPQTKYAQKLKAYEDELPSYIHAMDELASRAGLTIRHLRDRDWIVLVYSGTREQISCSGLGQYGEEFINWPHGTRVPSKLNLHKLWPWPRRFQRSGDIFKINEERYAIQIKEYLPREISPVAEGIECFEFSDTYGYVAYVGEKDKLIFEGIVGADMFPDDSTEDDGKEKTAPNASGYNLVLEETTRLHGGKWAYLKYPQHIEEAKSVKERTRKALVHFKTPEDYREWLVGTVDCYCRLVSLKEETQSGHICTVSAESKEAIQDAVDELYWALRDAVIHTRMAPPSEEEQAAKREQYAGAQNDAAFKAFVQGLIGNQDVH